MQGKTRYRAGVWLLLVLTAGMPAWAKKADKPDHGSAKKEKKAKKARPDGPALIWHDPGNILSLDLVYGAGGKEHEPAEGEFKFVKEDTNGTTPKFDIVDSSGVKWRAKLGIDAKTDTAATRLLWAVGYFVTENYYLPEVHVTGISKRTISRGQKYISDDGTMHEARLKRRPKGEKKGGNWSWFNNPFVGTKEFNGLRVMMALLNNWDLKEVNNGILVEKDGEKHYSVTDVDASFAKTGNYFTRSKGDLKAYQTAKFVEKTTPEEVDFVMSSRPFLFSAIDVGNYTTRTKMQDVAKHIPRADAKWLGGLLGQLSASQISDAFRTAGFSPEEVEGFTKVVQARIAELNAL